MRTYLKLCCTAIAVLALSGFATTAFADPTGGPIGGVARVHAGCVMMHTVAYNGGEQADFKIKGEGSTTLNIIVKDANGFEVGRTRGPGDSCLATWRPATTGVFYIFVVNEGSDYNQYEWRAY